MGSKECEIIESAENALLQNIEILSPTQNRTIEQSEEARRNISTLLQVLRKYKPSF